MSTFSTTTLGQRRGVTHAVKQAMMRELYTGRTNSYEN